MPVAFLQQVEIRFRRGVPDDGPAKPGYLVLQSPESTVIHDDGRLEVRVDDDSLFVLDQHIVAVPLQVGYDPFKLLKAFSEGEV